MKILKNKKFIFSLIFFSLLLAAPEKTIGVAAFDVSSFMGSKLFSQNINMLLSLALISMIPFLLISMTSFLRTVIVLGLIRSAIGTQQTPPAAVIVSIAIFMTVYVMTPVWQDVNKKAIEPYNQGKITQKIAFERGFIPIKQFMLRQAREKDMMLFIEFSKIPPLEKIEDIPMYVLIPAFIISELKTAFQIGFVIFLPFVIVDLIVANILLSLGMFMLSPVMVSLPFKILLFVLSDGWFLITRGLLQSFSFG